MDFYCMPDSKAAYGGQQNIDRYLKALETRRVKYPYEGSEHEEVVGQLNENGHATINNAIPLPLLEKVKGELDICLKEGVSLKKKNNRKNHHTGRRDISYARVIQPMVHCRTAYKVVFHARWKTDAHRDAREFCVVIPGAAPGEPVFSRPFQGAAVFRVGGCIGAANPLIDIAGSIEQPPGVGFKAADFGG